MKKIYIFLILLSLNFGINAYSQQKYFKFSSIYSSGMVLQRDLPLKFWGFGPSGENVTISIHDSTSNKNEQANTQIDSSGKWQIEFPARSYNKSGIDITASCVDSRIILNEVLIGDVWIISGQSNAGVGASAATDIWYFMKESAHHDNIRYTYLDENQGVDNKSIIPWSKDVKVKVAWTKINPELAASIPGIGYYFARHIHEKGIEVPIGLVRAQRGGLSALAYLTREHCQNSKEGKRIIAYADARRDSTQYKYLADLELSKQSQNSKKKIKSPAFPKAAMEETLNSFEGMIKTTYKPLFNFPIKGLIYYQGESDIHDGYYYRYTLREIVRFFRNEWGQGDFEFYIVQLPESGKLNNNPNPKSGQHELRESQAWVAQNMNNVELAVIMDTHVMTDNRLVDPLKDSFGFGATVHPGNKYLPALRLARIALNKVYQQKEIAYKTPEYRDIKIEGNIITLTFDHVGSGLCGALRTGSGEEFKYKNVKTPINWIAVASTDKVFHWEAAKIKGKNQLIIECKKVNNPVAVRYTWSSNPLFCNFYTLDGLPLSTFRTDTWEVGSQKINRLNYYTNNAMKAQKKYEDALSYKK